MKIHRDITSKLIKTIPLLILFILMFSLHRYVFLYADDLYYSRDAQIGVTYLPKLMINELNVNGRVWVHVLLSFLVKYDVLLFRIVNPLIIILTAYLIIKISINKNNKAFFITSISTCILFLLLDKNITNTTIYYAACALNYLYPLLVSLLLGYLIYNDYINSKENNKSKWWTIILAFFAASSTQQCGMIAIGFVTLIALYIKLVKREKIPKKFIYYFLTLAFGYAFVTYGSVKRLLFETSTGHSSNIKDSVIGLLKINIFSAPVSIFVIIVTICCILWLIHFSFTKNKLFSFQTLFNIGLSLALLMSLLAYLYLILYRDLDISVFITSIIDLKIKVFLAGFTIIYIFSLVYVSLLIAIKRDYPFVLFCIINAIGAQIMLLIADPRFANAYKIAFPSLLLIFVFISYSFSNLYHYKKLLCFLLILPLAILAYRTFNDNYMGYKNTSYNINYNLNAIDEYKKNSDKSVLVLKKVPPTSYGYNNGNWNSMPYFMKQCYKINDSTLIQYIE